MASKMTRKDVEALTESDVAAAKQRQVEARASRTGSSTIDFVLSQVDGRNKTLDAAKKHLLKLIAE